MKSIKSTHPSSLKFHLNYWIIIFLLLPSLIRSQDQSFDFTSPPQYGFRLRAEIFGTDTLPVVDLNTITIYGNFIYRNHQQYEKWTRIKVNVKKVYPYAILASAKLKEYDRTLASISDESLKKHFIKACELDLKNQFEKELKSLTVSQGKMLMKLIDRETGKTTYQIVRQMRGKFQANMWQAVATLFGHNMKSEYDPSHEDLMIERAIKVVESGFF